MAETVKVLGQSAPAATTETTLYTVPAATSAVVSTITVCNRSASTLAFRLGVSQGGGALASEDYLYYDVTVPGTDTFACTFGITMATTDKILVYASDAGLSFAAFGTEIT
jgi:hypothetical protein